MLSDARARPSVQKYSLRGHTCFERRQRKNVAINMRKFFFEIARRAGYRRYKNPYFIVFFAITTMHGRIWFARRACAPMMTTVVTQMRRRVSQLARVHVSLSGNAVFFAVL